MTASAPVARPRIPTQIWVLILAAFVIALGYGLIAPVLPQYAKSFDVGVAAASAIVSVFAFARLAFAPASGRLVSRLGERWVYLGGLLIVALSTGAAAFAQTYAQLLVFRGLGGIGSTMFTVSAMGLIVRLAPPTIRGRVSSAYGTAFLIGNVAGPLLGGLTLGFGYRLPFLLYAAALLVAVAVVAVLLPPTPVVDHTAEDAPAAMTVREALRDSAYRSALVAAFANGWSNFGVRIALVPLVAAATPGLGASMAGVSLTAFAIGNFLALQPSGHAVDRYGRKPLSMAGLVVVAVAMPALGTATTPVPFLLLSLVGGIGSGMMTPGQQASVADVIGSTRRGGSVLAAYQMSSDLGGICGPVIAGWVADRLGFGWAFGLTGAIVAMGALAWIPGRETLHRGGAAEAGDARDAEAEAGDAEADEAAEVALQEQAEATGIITDGRHPR